MSPRWLGLYAATIPAKATCALSSRYQPVPVKFSGVVVEASDLTQRVLKCY